MFSQQGQVAQVSEKPFRDKWGKDIILYSFQLQGDNRWYRTGTMRPPCNQGDSINFVFEQQGNNAKVDVNSLTGGGVVDMSQPAQAAPMQAPPAPPAPAPGGAPIPAPAPAPAATGGGTRDSYWKDKEEYDKKVTQPRIAYAAAQKSAVAVVVAALAHDVLGFGNAKKADKMEMLLGYVDEVTAKFAVDLDNAHNILAEIKSKPVESTTADEDAMYGDG